jgi:Tol biopolymer transport system component
MVWMDRDGKELDTIGDPAQYHDPMFSPDGKRLAYDLVDPHSGKYDIWVRDLTRNVSSRFSFSDGNAYCPVWSPDGARIAYSVGTDMVVKAADGQGAESPLGEKSGEGKFASDWSRDGKYIAFSVQAKDTNWDLWILPTFGDQKPYPFLKTKFSELWPAFSPDGRYIAYQSNESGRTEIYVQSFPGPGGKWQVSADGGTDAHWSGDGKELFFRSADQKLTAVPVTTGATFEAGTPKALFPVHLDPGTSRNRYIPAAVGDRFLLVATPARASMAPTTVVLNWMADLGK